MHGEVDAPGSYEQGVGRHRHQPIRAVHMLNCDGVEIVTVALWTVRASDYVVSLRRALISVTVRAKPHMANSSELKKDVCAGADAARTCGIAVLLLSCKVGHPLDSVGRGSVGM